MRQSKQKGNRIVELQIQDLVSAIKKDGIDAAQKTADEMIAQAKKKADVQGCLFSVRSERP